MSSTPRLRDRAWYPPMSGALSAVLMSGLGLAFRWPWWLALLVGCAMGRLQWWTDALRRDRRLRGLDDREMGLH